MNIHVEGLKSLAVNRLRRVLPDEEKGNTAVFSVREDASEAGMAARDFNPSATSIMDVC